MYKNHPKEPWKAPEVRTLARIVSPWSLCLVLSMGWKFSSPGLLQGHQRDLCPGTDPKIPKSVWQDKVLV